MVFVKRPENCSVKEFARNLTTIGKFFLQFFCPLSLDVELPQNRNYYGSLIYSI